MNIIYNYGLLTTTWFIDIGVLAMFDTHPRVKRQLTRRERAEEKLLLRVLDPGHNRF